MRAHFALFAFVVTVLVGYGVDAAACNSVNCQSSGTLSSCFFGVNNPDNGNCCQSGNGQVICSGAGYCILQASSGGTDHCHCMSGFAGPTCAVNCATACGAHSAGCTSTDDVTATCFCTPGYKGSACQYQCPGGDDTQACNGHGTCTLSGTVTSCSCSFGYVGPACQYACPTDSIGNVCASHGTCSQSGSNAICTCTGGYTGTACDKCPAGYGGYPSCVACPTTRQGTACAGHGNCITGSGGSGTAVCNCTAGYALATNKCHDGIYLDNSPCSDPLQLSGYVCAACPRNIFGKVCSSHGTCITNRFGNVTSCLCDAGFGGPLCDQCDYVGGFRLLRHVSNAVGTYPNCQICTANNCAANNQPNWQCQLVNGSPTCVCPADYVVNQFQQCQACPGGCSGHGTCTYFPNDPVQTDRCVCATGFNGTNCDRCASRYMGYPHCTPCSAAFAGATCNTCSPGYVGWPLCLPCPTNSTGSICSKRGTCAMRNGEATCTCTNGYEPLTACACPAGTAGSSCQFTCPRNATGAVCSGHGRCQAGVPSGAICVCDVNWVGSRCDFKVPAGGIPPGTQCPTGTAGPSCQFQCNSFCGSAHPYCSTNACGLPVCTCGGHGTAVRNLTSGVNDVCYCDATYEGDQCQYSAGSGTCGNGQQLQTAAPPPQFGNYRCTPEFTISCLDGYVYLASQSACVPSPLWAPYANMDQFADFAAWTTAVYQAMRGVTSSSSSDRAWLVTALSGHTSINSTLADSLCAQACQGDNRDMIGAQYSTLTASQIANIPMFGFSTSGMCCCTASDGSGQAVGIDTSRAACACSSCPLGVCEQPANGRCLLSGANIAGPPASVGVIQCYPGFSGINCAIDRRQGACNTTSVTRPCSGTSPCTATNTSGLAIVVTDFDPFVGDNPWLVMRWFTGTGQHGACMQMLRTGASRTAALNYFDTRLGFKPLPYPPIGTCPSPYNVANSFNIPCIASVNNPGFKPQIVCNRGWTGPRCDTPSAL